MTLLILHFRDLGTPQRGFGSVLPRHNPEYNKMHLETTHKADYQPPDPEYSPVPVSKFISLRFIPMSFGYIRFVHG
jgi:hypothetical protein